MKRTFALDEQTTTLTIDATDRSLIRVYTNDSVFVAKMKQIGAVLFKDCGDGGMFYDLRADQMVLRKGKKQLSESGKAALEKARNNSPIGRPKNVQGHE